MTMFRPGESGRRAHPSGRAGGSAARRWDGRLSCPRRRRGLGPTGGASAAGPERPLRASRHRRGRGRLSLRCARHLERHRPGRPAGGLRRPEAGGARGRRPSDPEPRHPRRQSLQCLARRRRFADAAAAGGRNRNGEPARHPPSAARRLRHRQPADEARPRRAGRRAAYPAPAGRCGQPVSQARQSALSGDLHRRRRRPGGARRVGRHRVGAHRRRGLLAGRPPFDGAGSGARRPSHRRWLDAAGRGDGAAGAFADRRRAGQRRLPARGGLRAGPPPVDGSPPGRVAA